MFTFKPPKFVVLVYNSIDPKSNFLLEISFALKMKVEDHRSYFVIKSVT
jgi:hypothetical protein